MKQTPTVTPPNPVAVTLQLIPILAALICLGYYILDWQEKFAKLEQRQAATTAARQQLEEAQKSTVAAEARLPEARAQLAQALEAHRDDLEDIEAAPDFRESAKAAGLKVEQFEHKNDLYALEVRGQPTTVWNWLVKITDGTAIVFTQVYISEAGSETQASLEFFALSDLLEVK